MSKVKMKKKILSLALLISFICTGSAHAFKNNTVLNAGTEENVQKNIYFIK